MESPCCPAIAEEHSASPFKGIDVLIIELIPIIKYGDASTFFLQHALKLFIIMPI